MQFNDFYIAIEEQTQRLHHAIDGIVDGISGDNIEELELYAMEQMKEAEADCFRHQQVESLGNKTIEAYVQDMDSDTFMALLKDPMLYLLDFLPDSVTEKVAAFAGTDLSSQIASIIKGFCSLKFDSQAIEVATALKLYANCPDQDLADVIFRLNEASFRMAEQGDSEWELVQDAVVDALHLCPAEAIAPVVIGYINEATNMTAMHTPLLRYLVEYPEYAEQSYMLLKRGVKESPERAFLLELFGKVGNRRGISFIRGFVEKNPSIVDGLFLSEAIRAIIQLEGDPNDLVELYQQMFSGDEQ